MMNNLTEALSARLLIAIPATTVIFYLFSLVIYRLTLHPLAKYPGPLSSKISDWPLTWQCTTGDRHIRLLMDHRKHGPIVRIGPNTLCFSSVEALRQIYPSTKDRTRFRKSEYYNTINTPSGGHSLHSETSPSKHVARRRVLEHAFTPAALRSNEPFIIEAVDLLCKAVSPTKTEEWSQPKDMRDYAAWFAYDVMGSLMFGRRFDCLIDNAHRYVPRLIITGMPFLYSTAHAPCRRLVRYFLSSPRLMHSVAGSRARDELAFMQYSHACMASRLGEGEEKDGAKPEMPEQKRDMMHYIIQASKDPESGRNYGRNELAADAVLLIAAGSDTTSVTLSALLFYLTLPTSKDALAKLNNEIRNPGQFSGLESITGSMTMTLPYLRACIDEALRLAPPVATHLPRTVTRKEGVEIDGHCIPAGVDVGASAYVLHHDEHAFPHPWQFDPDRWIVDGNVPYRTGERVDQAKEAFLPFSIGSRNCLGKDLAYRELCVCVARVVFLFDMKRAADDVPSRVQGTRRAGHPIRQDEYQIFDYFLVDRDGPNIQFRRRL